MTEKTQVELIVDMLNTAWANNPEAIHSLICNSIPCNDKLVDDPHIVVSKNNIAGGYTVSALGLLNGVLSAASIEQIAIHWSDTKDETGGFKFLGFTVYTPKDRLTGAAIPDTTKKVDVKISTEDILAFRDKTNLPLMVCQKAMHIANGDQKLAFEYTRFAGQAIYRKSDLTDTQLKKLVITNGFNPEGLDRQELIMLSNVVDTKNLIKYLIK